MIKYVRSKKTISGRLQDELVMMDIEQGKYFSLNQTAAIIWEMLEEPLTPEEICDRLSEEYDTDMEQCLFDTMEYLDEMKKLGLAEITEE